MIDTNIKQNYKMSSEEELENKTQLWVNSKINKLKELKDKKQVSNTIGPEMIERLLTHKKRSIYPIPKASLEGLRHEIKLSIAEDRPIRLITPFGSYKPANLPSPSAANWAEFIHLAYISEMASQISLIYPRGVEIVYKLEDIDMDLLADVTDRAIDRYCQTFNKLVDRFRHWVSPKITFQVLRLSDLVSKAEYRQFTEVQIDRLRPMWERNRNSDKVLTVCDRTKRNNANLSLCDRDIFEKALRSEAMIIADIYYLCEDKAINLIYRKITDVMVNNQQGKVFFPFRSCSGSLVQFWVGEGGLIWNGKKIYPVIFGQNSLKKATVLKRIDSHQFQECGSNFNTITIYSKD